MRHASHYSGHRDMRRWALVWHAPLGPPPHGGDPLAWAVVWLVAGIFLYYTHPGLSSWQMTLPAGLLLLAARWWWQQRQGRALPLLVPAALLLLGMALAALHVARQDTPLLPANVGSVQLHGVVEHVTPHRPRQARMVVRVRFIDRVRQRHWPLRVRLTLAGLPRRADAAQARLPLPGDEVHLRARLLRLPRPVAPGAWDPARDLYMAGIGAVGYAHVAGMTIRHARCEGCSLSLRLARWLERQRRTIAATIASHMADDRAAALAQALTIGARGVLPQQVREHLRAAGLAHILAISGLHMALVAGAVFWLVRAALALCSPLALRWPLKKIAAVTAWLAALVYLLLSGNSVATQRAFVMLSIALLALLAERPAISMRNLALAALFILLLWPHKALSAGFQMSFLAVMGLVATYEAIAWWRMRSQPGTGVRHGMAQRLARRLLAAAAALVLTTIVASAFTALPAVWHFHRLPVHGLLGNLAALPLLSLLVMPAALLALAFMPLAAALQALGVPAAEKLPALPLAVMEQGLRGIVRAADAIAALPGSWWHVPALSVFATVLLAAGLLWLALRTDRLRLLGLLPVGLVLAGLWSPFASRPDVLVEDRARLVAVRGADGLLAATPGRAGNFVLRLWLRRDGDAATPRQARRRPGWRCDAGVCRATLPSGVRVVYLRKRRIGRRRLAPPVQQQLAACRDAEVVIAAFPLRGLCRGAGRIVVDRFDVWRRGAHALAGAVAGRLRVIVAQRPAPSLPWTREPLPRHRVLRRPQRLPGLSGN